jgi:hypothetical protein
LEGKGEEREREREREGEGTYLEDEAFGNYLGELEGGEEV